MSAVDDIAMLQGKARKHVSNAQASNRVRTPSLPQDTMDRSVSILESGVAMIVRHDRP